MANGLQRGNDIRAVVHTCPSDCKEAYQQVLDEVERVKDAGENVVRFELPKPRLPIPDYSNKIQGILDRNKIINDKYAQLYRDMPENRWAGLASIVSSQMGCNMHLMTTVTFDYAAAINHLSGQMSDFIGTEGVLALGEGNMAIFEQVYPPLRMAASCGKKKFLECVKKGEITPDGELVKAIQQFDDGDTNAAIERIVNFEQNTVAQPIYDKNQDAFAHMRMAAAWAKKVGFDLESIPLSTRCGAGGRIPFNTADDLANLSSADDRIQYFRKLNSLWNGHLD